MIRFVPVGEAIYPDISEYSKAFAFFCTSSDRFLTFGGSQQWKDWRSFVHDYSENNPTLKDIERYRNHCESNGIEITVTLWEEFAYARKILMPVDEEKIRNLKKDYELYRSEGGKLL